LLLICAFRWSTLIFGCVCLLTFRITKTIQMKHSSVMTAHTMRITVFTRGSSGHFLFSSFCFVFFSFFSSVFFNDRIEIQGQRIRAILYVVFHSVLIKKSTVIFNLCIWIGVYHLYSLHTKYMYYIQTTINPSCLITLTYP